MTPTAPSLTGRIVTALVLALALAPLAADAARKPVKKGPKSDAVETAKPADDAKPADAAKADEKKAEEPKPEEKKADAPKADEKKPEEKKADEKKPEEKKADAPKADEKKPDEKKADAKPAEAPKKVEEPAERIIEKGDSDLLARLVLKPGVLKPRRVAELYVEFSKKRDEADMIEGDRAPVLADVATLVVTAPAPAADKKSKKPAAENRPLEFELAPAGQPGAYFAHFTPPTDGVYQLKLIAGERPEEGAPIKLRDVTFRIGVGTATAETEAGQAQGKGRRGTARRRVVGAASTKVDDRLQKLMAELGEQYLELEALFADAPAKGPFPAGAVALRAFGEKVAAAKGLTPAAYGSSAEEFDALAAKLVERLEAAAVAAEKPKDPKAAATAKAAFAQVQSQSCLQCHAKFRWGISTEVAAWPDFERKPWKK